MKQCDLTATSRFRPTWTSAWRGMLAALATAPFLVAWPVAGSTVHWERTNYQVPPPYPLAGWDQWYGLKAVTYGNGTFVAVGDRICVSADGVHWQSYDSPTLTELNSVIYADGKFVAVGGAYSQAWQNINNYRSAIAVSEDGIHWNLVLEERLASEVVSPVGSNDFFLADVAYGNGRFVACGNGVGWAILTSTNGLNWERVTTQLPSYCNSIAFGNGRFVIAGLGLRTSEDGLTWSPHPGPWDDADLMRVRYGNQRFVVVGNESTIYASPDGIAWTRDELMNAGDGHVWLEDVALGAGVGVGVGELSLLTMDPASPWMGEDTTSLTPPAPLYRMPASVRGVAYARGQFIVVGDNNLVLRGQVTPTPPLLSGFTLGPRGEPGFRLHVTPDFTYRIDVSYDLRDWNLLRRVTRSQEETVQVSDPQTAPGAIRFYRAVVEPAGP